MTFSPHSDLLFYYYHFLSARSLAPKVPYFRSALEHSLKLFGHGFLLARLVIPVKRFEKIKKNSKIKAKKDLDSAMMGLLWVSLLCYV